MDIHMSGRFLPAFFLLPWTVFAQTPEIRFERLQLEPGAVDHGVYDVVQDSVGFLWIATVSGLFRYDGSICSVFRPALNDTTGISSMVTWSVLAGRDRQLWIGTFDGGLDSFDPVTEKFTRHRHNPGDSSSISAGAIKSMVYDAAGAIWVGMEHTGVNRLDPVTDVFTHFAHGPHALPGSSVNALCRDSTGAIWVGTNDGLSVIDPRSGRMSPHRHRPGDTASLSDNAVTALVCDRAGDVWVGTLTRGLNRLGRNSTRWIRYGTREEWPRHILCDSVTAMHEASSGELWIGTPHGVMTFDPRSGTCARYVHDPQDPNSLSANYVSSITGDRAGNIWIGADDDASGSGIPGLNKVVLRARQLVHYRVMSEGGARLTVLALYHEPGSGDLWIGTMDGLRRWNAVSGSTQRVRRKTQHAQAGPDIISALCVDRSGAMWVGTWMSGFSLFDRASGTFQDFDPAANETDGGKSVIAIAEDAGGAGSGRSSGTSLWIGLFADGLVQFTRGTRAMIHFRHDPADPASLSDNRVLAACVDRKGVLWVGTDGGGLEMRAPGAGGFVHYRHDDGNPASIRSNSVCALCEDPSAGTSAGTTLWLGTTTGLDRFDGAAGRATHIALLDSGTAVRVVGIHERNDVVWVATDRNGLFRVDPVTGRVRSFTAEDGLHGDQCSRAFCEGPGGRLYVGAGDGFTSFIPDSLRDLSAPPPVVCESFLLFDVPVRSVPPLWTRPLIHLNYDQDFFSFRFAVLDFTNPRKNAYAYRLEEFEEQWHSAGQRNFAGYTKVDPGRYVLRVRGANSDGVWNDAGTAIDIVVDPPYWKTWWFRSLAAALVIALGAAAYNYRVAKLLEVERLRVRIASDLHDDIGSTLSGIALVTDSLGARLPLPDADRRRLADVTAAARRTADSLRDIVWLVNPGHDTLDDMLLRMNDAAAAILVDIANTVTCTGVPLSSTLPMEVRRNIILVYKEILNNIVRHSSARTVRIAISEAGGNFVLRVADDGAGFDPAAVKRGNGLDSLERRARQVGGAIRIESAPAHGATVQLTVPLTHKEVAR